jgi:diguanylate cyclase (GGDEF)-like protein
LIRNLQHPIEALEEHRMDVSDNAPDQTDENLTSNSSTLWKTVGPALLLVVGVAAVIGIAKLLPFFLAENSNQVLRTTLAVAAVCLAVAMTLRHRRQWVLPANEMRRLIHLIRVGRAPIEEFAASNFGCLGELGAEATLLLQDLRQQRQAVNELKEEVRQRIANRTSVLERTIASLRNQAARDPLTGLYNRRMLDQLLPQLIAQFQTEHKSLTLIMIDLDYFKKLNDTLGHAAGDEMLKAVGQIIHSTIRDDDFGFRYGGDEFVLLLPGCDAAVSKRICERLQSLVSSMGKTYKVAQSPRLSIGVSTLAELSEPNAANLLKKADERLYETKARRNGSLPAATPEAA